MLFANETAFDDVLVPVARAQGVDPALLKAMVAQESGFDPQAYHYDANVNDASRGLAQIEGSTARALGLPIGDDATRTGGLYDPNIALPAMAHIVAANLRRAGGDVPTAVAAYNSGWSKQRPADAPRDAAGRFISQAYVDRVLGHFYPYYAAQQGGDTQDTGGATPAPTPPPTTAGPELVTGLLSVAVAVAVWWWRRARGRRRRAA